VRVASVIYCAAPGAKGMNYLELSYKFIESDQFGRRLYAFHTTRAISLSGILIIQNADSKNVYYYDNYSYFITSEYLQYSTEELDKLKEINDWDNPLVAEKMVKRRLVNRFDFSDNRESAIDISLAINAFNYSIQEVDNVSTSIKFFDYSQSNQELFFISRDEKRVTENDSRWFNIDYYLMILNADGTYDPENYLIKIDDLSQSNEALAEIKERNGWVG